MTVRVVSYSRVSSDHDDQRNSLKNQKEHWEDFIKNNPDWEYAGMYWDEGITGTSLKKRDGFNQMIRDAYAGKFDLIITKQVSRWARNIVDSIQTARELAQIGVGVYFATDNIHTLNDPDAELRLSIMSTLAQEESRRISEAVKFGHKRAMKKGVVYGANRVLGYDIKNKTIVVNEKEAEVVKKIFDWFVYEKESLHGIVRRLDKQNQAVGKLGGKLEHSSISRMLRNEKYCGDLKQRKYYTDNYLEQKQKVNKGEKEFITIEDNHEPIVSKEQWNKAQQILKERRVKYVKGVGYQRHCWGGKIICKDCGDKFRRKTLRNKVDNSPRPVWICATYQNHGTNKCNNGGYIREELLEEMVRLILKEIRDDETRKKLLNNVQIVLEKVLVQNDSQKKKKDKIQRDMEKIQHRRDKLMDLYMDSNIKIDYLNKQNESLNRDEEILIGELNEIQEMESKLHNIQSKTKNFVDMITSEIHSPENIDDIVNDHIKEIIKDKQNITFIFNVGDEFKISYDKLPRPPHPTKSSKSKHPKRDGNLKYFPIMDTSLMYLVSRGICRYYDRFDIQVKIAI